MASSRFRENLARVLIEAREQGHRDAVEILLTVFDLLDAGRYEELPDRIAALRPIFRARLGPLPGNRVEDRGEP